MRKQLARSAAFKECVPCRFNIWIEVPVRDPRSSESRTTMSEFRLIPNRGLVETAPAVGGEPVSEPERELNSFINAVTSLIGPGGSRSLTELWLNELACMQERIPGSEDFNWRSVSVSASVRLAGRVIASQLSGPCF